MPGRSRGHGDGHGGNGQGGAAPRRRTPHAGTVDDGQESVGAAFEDGRARPEGTVPAGGPHGRPDDLVTQRTGTPGGSPEGRPTHIEPDDDQETRRSIEMENSGAATIAGAGYRIKQNPTPDEVAEARRVSGDYGDPAKNPDYLIEGRVFDCYSPTNPAKAVRGVWWETQRKIEKLQTQRVVVNLEDWTGDLTALRRQFADWPVQGLKEVKVITPSGTVVQIDLPPTNG